MKPSLLNLGRYSRLALLLLMLAAQGVANAHDISGSHAFSSDACSTCIIGHGMGTAINASVDTPALAVSQSPVPVHAVTVTLASPTTGHFARAPPLFSWNT